MHHSPFVDMATIHFLVWPQALTGMFSGINWHVLWLPSLVDMIVRLGLLPNGKITYQSWTVAIDSIWVSLIAGLDSPLERGTGTRDWILLPFMSNLQYSQNLSLLLQVL